MVLQNRKIILFIIRQRRLIYPSAQYISVIKKFFDQEEIGALIDRKADIELLSHLEEKKANVKDISTLHSLFLRLDEKMKYLSVL